MSLAGTTRVRVLSEVVQALQTADSQSLLPLLHCLRQACCLHKHFASKTSKCLVNFHCRHHRCVL